MARLATLFWFAHAHTSWHTWCPFSLFAMTWFRICIGKPSVVHYLDSINAGTICTPNAMQCKAPPQHVPIGGGENRRCETLQGGFCILGLQVLAQEGNPGACPSSNESYCTPREVLFSRLFLHGWQSRFYVFIRGISRDRDYNPRRIGPSGGQW